MSYDIILADADRTLLDFDKGEKISLFNALKNMGYTPNNEIYVRYAQINNMLWEKHERGEITKSQIIDERFQMLFDEFSLKGDRQKFSEQYVLGLSNSAYLIHNALKLLKTLVEQNKRVFLITNGTSSVQKSRFNKCRIKKYISDIFISDDIGVTKPNKEFFDYVFEHIDGFRLDKVILLGDSESADILGAKNASIPSILFDKTGKKQTQADYKIKDLLEVIDIVK